MIKSALTKILGLKNIGKLEYFINNDLKEVWGGPFNGQKMRQSIFLEILGNQKINYIVETGTFRGSTTAFFAQWNIPVFSVELNKRYFGYSKVRLKKFDHVKIFNDNSINFLNKLSANNSLKNIFFYLDAHGTGNNHPLKDEVDLIFSNFTNSIVMIDDFEVPTTNYGFDTRLGEKLNINLLKTLINKYNLNIYFPSHDPLEETGSKRGMVLLCKEKEIDQILLDNKLISKYN